MLMDSASPEATVVPSLPTPPTTFYANDNPKNWTVEVISRGLMVEETGCKEIRLVLKRAMEKRHLIGNSLSAPHNEVKLKEALKEMEVEFPLVFRSDIPRQWLESCKLGMARKISYTYTHACNRRQRKISPADVSEDPEIATSTPQPQTFGNSTFYVESRKTQINTIISPEEITRTQNPPQLVLIDEIDFDMFTNILRQDKLLNTTKDRIMWRMGNKDIEIDHSRKFKVAARTMYKEGRNPISFRVVEHAKGERLYLDRSCWMLMYLKEDRSVQNRGSETRNKIQMHPEHRSYLTLSLTAEDDMYGRMLEYSDDSNMNGMIVMFPSTSSSITSDTEISQRRLTERPCRIPPLEAPDNASNGQE